MNLVLIKGEKYYDISNIVESVKWSGRKGAASRSITVNLLDDVLRCGIDVGEGHQCVFSYDGDELFRGMIMVQTQSQKKKLVFTAHDNGIYLANNKDTFHYESKTASDIFIDCCKRFGLPYSEVVKTEYQIPELIKPSTTAFDTICDALSLDFKATGVRHYIKSQKGVLSLFERRENIVLWVLETSANISAYSYKKSIENVKTRIKMLSDEDTVVAQKSNDLLEGKIGVFQDVEKADETFSMAQILELAQSILEEKNTPERALQINDVLGNVEIVSGIGVFVSIPHIGINKAFYVDSDTHTFNDQQHSMSVTLNYACDIGKKKDAVTGEAYKVGDVVWFNGGTHYVSSSGSTGSNASAGPARISIIVLGSLHPYHLIKTSSQSNIYGWVNDGTFTREAK